MTYGIDGDIEEDGRLGVMLGVGFIIINIMFPGIFIGYPGYSAPLEAGGTAPDPWIDPKEHGGDITADILAPIIEEGLFRSYLLSVAEMYLPFPLDIALNAVLFAGFHWKVYGLQLSSALVGAGVFSVIACLVVKETDSILPVIIMHSIVNTWLKNIKPALSMANPNVEAIMLSAGIGLIGGVVLPLALHYLLKVIRSRLPAGSMGRITFPRGVIHQVPTSTSSGWITFPPGVIQTSSGDSGLGRITNKAVMGLIMVLLLIGCASAYTISGDSVFYGSTYANLTITPHTARSPVNDYSQTFIVNSKAFAGDLCIAYKFNERLQEAEIKLEKNISYQVSVDDYIPCVKNYSDNETYTDFYNSTCYNGSHQETRYRMQFDGVSSQFSHAVNGSHIYYHDTPLSFNEYEDHKWRIRYKPAENDTSGKWDAVLWNSKSGSCVNDYLSGNHDFKYEIDPWFTGVSFAKRMMINCTGMADGDPIVINGSSGLCGGAEEVWTYCSGINTSLYYNTLCGASGDYGVYNDTTHIPTEVIGNGADYNPTEVWAAKNLSCRLGEEAPQDSSINGWNFTEVGTITVGSGKIGNAISLDGQNDWANFDTFPGIHLQDFTLEFWMYNLADYGGPDNSGIAHFVIFFAGSKILCGADMGPMGRGGCADCFSCIVDDDSGWEAIDIQAGDISANTWYHVAFVSDAGSNISIYLDGVFKDNATVGPIDAGGGGQSNLGGDDAGGNSYPWNGSIDELRIWNRALTHIEIAASYRNQNGTDTYGTLGAEEAGNADPGVTAGPTITSPLDTNTNAECTGTAEDAESDPIDRMEFFWYNQTDGSIIKSGNKTNVANNTATVIDTLASSEFTAGDNINCSIRAYDGAKWSSTTYNSSNMTISTLVPALTLKSPEDNSTDGIINPILNVTVTDGDGDLMNVTFYNSSGTAICVNLSISTGADVKCNNWSGLTENTTYEWYVNVTDGVATTKGTTWNFTTLYDYPAGNITVTPDPPVAYNSSAYSITAAWNSTDPSSVIDYYLLNVTYANGTFIENCTASPCALSNYSIGEYNLTLFNNDTRGYSNFTYYNFSVTDQEIPVPYNGGISLNVFETGGNTTISVQVNESYGSISWVRVQIEWPRAVKYNYTMDLSTGNTYYYNFINTTTGNYDLDAFYASDDSGNIGTLSSLLEFDITGPPVSEDTDPEGGVVGGPVEVNVTVYALNITPRFVAQHSVPPLEKRWAYEFFTSRNVTGCRTTNTDFKCRVNGSRVFAWYDLRNFKGGFYSSTETQLIVEDGAGNTGKSDIIITVVDLRPWLGPYYATTELRFLPSEPLAFEVDEGGAVIGIRFFTLLVAVVLLFWLFSGDPEKSPIPAGGGG